MLTLATEKSGAGLQREEPIAAAERTSGQRHQADIQPGSQCPHNRLQSVGPLPLVLLSRDSGAPTTGPPWPGGLESTRCGRRPFPQRTTGLPCKLTSVHADKKVGGSDSACLRVTPVQSTVDFGDWRQTGRRKARRVRWDGPTHCSGRLPKRRHLPLNGFARMAHMAGNGHHGRQSGPHRTTHDQPGRTIDQRCAGRMRSLAAIAIDKPFTVFAEGQLQ